MPRRVATTRSSPGSGSIAGAKGSIVQRARAEAAGTGLLPHEWLLKIVRGEPIAQSRWEIVRDSKGNPKKDKDGKVVRELVHDVEYPPMDVRVDAAKAAAPYYAPRLAIQAVTLGDKDPAQLVELMKQFAKHLPV